MTNATDIVTVDPGAKELFPNDEFAVARGVVSTIASSEYIEGGVWRRTGDVRFRNDGEDINLALDPFISWPGLEQEPASRAEADASIAELQAQLFSSPTTVPTGADAVATLAGAAGHWSLSPTATPPYAKFPTTTSTLKASLASTSLTWSSFHVRVEYRLPSPTAGSVTVALSGPGMSSSRTWTTSNGSGRVVASFDVTRTGVVTQGTDTVTLTGRNMDILSISVRPERPQLASNGSYFEYVVLDHGVTQSTARALASRSVFASRIGRLARFSSTALLTEVGGVVDLDAPAWVDANRPAGSSDWFRWADGTLVYSDRFRPGTDFASPRPRGADVFMWPEDPASLGHSGPAAAVVGSRTGFWIEYPAPGALAAQGFSSDDASLDASMSMVGEQEGEQEGSGGGDVPAEAPPIDEALLAEEPVCSGDAEHCG